jgi:hypothetical protein
MTQPIDVHIISGQSNADGPSPAATIGPLSRVPAYDRNLSFDWSGSPAASIDSGIAYNFPTLSSSPSMYTYCPTGGIDSVVDNWGPYDKAGATPTVCSCVFSGTSGGTFTLTYGGNTTGAITWSSAVASLMGNIKAALEALPGMAVGDVVISIYVAQFTWSPTGTQAHSTSIPTVGSIAGLTGSTPSLTLTPRTTFGGYQEDATCGPELTFLYNYRKDNPNVTIACIKNVLGGSAIATWRPITYPVGTAQAGSSSSITLQSGDFVTLVGLRIGVIVGGVVVSWATVLSLAGSVATIDTWTGISPTTGSSYGVEASQFAVLRTDLTLAVARLTAAGIPFRFKSFLWYQGESGSQGNFSDDSTYIATARAIFAAVRALTSTPNLPVIVARIADIWMDDRSILGTLTNGGSTGVPGGTTRASIALLKNGVIARRASEVTLGSDPNCCWYSNDGYIARPLQNDGFYYHNFMPGVMAGGERAYAALKALTGPKGATSVNFGGSHRTFKSRA